MESLQYIQKINLQPLLSRFVETCHECKQERRFSYIESYLSGETICNECKSRLRLLTFLLPVAIRNVAEFFSMTTDEFKTAMQKNMVIKRAVLSFLEGVGRYGIRTPQPLGAPFFVIVSITQHCNLQCSFCYNADYLKNNKPSEMGTEQIKMVIDQLSEAGCLGIGFNGGEPTLRDDLCELVSYASSKFLIPLIATNAVLITKDYAEELRKAGLCYAQVSLDGNSETHDRLCGRKGAYAKTLEGLNNLVNAGIYVSVAMVATKENYLQIDHVLEIAKKYQTSKFEILDYQRVGKADATIDLNPQERELLAERVCSLWQDTIQKKEKISLLYKNPSFFQTMKKTFSDVQTVNLFGAAFPTHAMEIFDYQQRMTDGIFTVQDPFSPIATCCEAGLYGGLFIDVDGTITPCPYMPLAIGNIFKQGIHDVWTHAPVLNLLRDRSNLNGPCKNCENDVYCGGCRARSFTMTGDFLSSDPLCPKTCK